MNSEKRFSRTAVVLILLGTLCACVGIGERVMATYIQVLSKIKSSIGLGLGILLIGTDHLKVIVDKAFKFTNPGSLIKWTVNNAKMNAIKCLNSAVSKRLLLAGPSTFKTVHFHSLLRFTNHLSSDYISIFMIR